METGFGDSPLGLQAKVLYESGIKQKMEPEHVGKYLVIDVTTGDYDYDADDYAVAMRAYDKNPQGRRFCVRIGHKASGIFRVAVRKTHR